MFIRSLRTKSAPITKRNKTVTKFDKNFFGTYAKTQQLFEQSKPGIAQGISGSTALITGNFSYFTKHEANAIAKSLERGNTFIIIYDRDYIPVPANERAMWMREYFNHHPQLEVRVAYGPPPEKEGNEDHFITYIKKQLPSHIEVSSVRCHHPYSPLLAQSLGVQHEFLPDLKDSGKIEKMIRGNPKDYEHLLIPSVAKRVIAPFKSIIDEAAFKTLYERELATVKADIDKSNPNHPNKDDLFSCAKWDMSALNKINLPIVIGNITDENNRILFGNRSNAQVFDMPIYMPGQGWKIPIELAPYQYVLAKITAAESLANREIAECNAYVTIDCGVVHPNGYARREGLHVDGFLTKANARPGKDGIVWGDNTYIVSDCQALQTELYPGPFDLSRVDQDKPQTVLKAFNDQGQHMSYKQHNAYDIVRLNTNHVHAVHPNLTNEYLQRCFLKMTFSERLFNRSGNTINPNFNYRFTYIPREAGRNTQNLSGVVPVGFDEVDLREIDFKHRQFPQWVSSTSLSVSKNPAVCITAIPATEGEILETKIDGHVVTTNIARVGDMKVTRTNGDSYFLGDNFRLLYKPIEGNKYVPTPRTLTALRVSKNISFLANWGTRQHIPEGGYIVQDDHGDTWGVHQKSFEATYQKRP